MEQDRGNGIEISLGDLVFAVSAALDLVSPVVANHHLKVSRIARAIAHRLGLPASVQRDLLLAAHQRGQWQRQQCAGRFWEVRDASPRSPREGVTGRIGQVECGRKRAHGFGMGLPPLPE